MIAALVLGAGAATASAASPIEGVWAFGGGQISIKEAGAGTFVGTVVHETSFAECVHPVGQELWTEVKQQSDGSYWGLHAWFFEKTCAPNPELGHAAFRVLASSSNERLLKVCLSYPGGPQPKINAEGKDEEATYGCVESALTATTTEPTGTGTTTTTTTIPTATPKSGVENFKELVKLPPGAKCLSVRSFKIHILDPKHDAFKSITITIGKRHIKAVRRGDTITATVNLKGLPKGSFTVKISAVTYLGARLSGSRTYHTCSSKSRKKKASTSLH